MKGYPGAVKSVMTGATLASLLLLGGANADARDGRGAEALLSRKLDYEPARPDLGPDVSACWKKSGCLVATSARGWQEEMERLQGDLCLLPAPDAPKENWSQNGLLVVAYSQALRGGAPLTADVRGVSRTCNTLTVDVSLSLRTDGCGYCDQDEVRLSRHDLVDVNTVVVRYTDETLGSSVSAESYSVPPESTSGPVSNVVSWGSLKAMYR